MNDRPPTSATPRIPLAVKVGYTLFMAILVPYYWREYGPTNFLYFCDVALFLALLSVWTEWPLFASMAIVGILVPQLVWQVDFLSNLAGFPITGMTDYMFDTGISLFGRCLSFFHFWLPMLLVYLVYRVGYDRRALAAWTLAAWGLMLVSYYLLPAPGDPLSHRNEPRNVNYVFGMGEAKQTWMPEAAWLGLLMVGLPIVAYVPAHLAMIWVDRKARVRNAAVATAGET